METDFEVIWRSRLYVICGILILSANAICFIVFNSCPDFRKRFLFFIMLSVSDSVNGASFVIAGYGRIKLVERNSYNIPITNYECLTNYLWPIFFILGGQLPATFHCLLTLERVLAVYHLSWYRSYWNWKYRLYATIIGLLFCISLNIISFLISFYDHSIHENRLCSVMDSIGLFYGTIHFSWIACSYLVSFLVILRLFFRSSKILKKTECRKQLVILILSAVNVIFVSIPNIILVSDKWMVDGFSVLTIGISYLLYGFQSCFNLPIFYFFRLEFRIRLHEIFMCKIIGRKPSILSNELNRQRRQHCL